MFVYLFLWWRRTILEWLCLNLMCITFHKTNYFPCCSEATGFEWKTCVFEAGWNQVFLLKGKQRKEMMYFLQINKDLSKVEVKTLAADEN